MVLLDHIQMENMDKDKQKKPQFGDEADVSNSSCASRYALLSTDGFYIFLAWSFHIHNDFCKLHISKDIIFMSFTYCLL